jgi:hypothetical protein
MGQEGEAARRGWLNSLPKGDFPVTRLVCARMYLFGLPASLAVLNRLLGMPVSALQPSIAYDHQVVLFHALQSTLFSLLFLLIAGSVYYLPIEHPESSDILVIAIGVLVTVKIAVINPVIARVYFSAAHKDRNLRIPGIAILAVLIMRILVKESEMRHLNAVYFKGPRPFVGFGSEINAWTIVIDTTVKDQSFETLVKEPSKHPSDIDVQTLYDAVTAKVEELQLTDIDSSWAVFIDGNLPEDQTRPRRKIYRPPPVSVPDDEIDQLDSEGNKGRCYYLLQSNNREQDLCVSQFIRFRKNGNLIFGEFASHVIPPAKKRYYFIDRLFQINPLIYLLWGIIILGLACVVSLILSPFLENLLWLEMPWGFFNSYAIDEQYFQQQILTGWVLLRVVALSLVILVLFIAWRIILWLYVYLGIFLGLRCQYGLPKTFREHIAKGGPLDYYELQSVIYFLKAQEKILTQAMVGELCSHGIDVSDLKENISAFINQGVINSGEIRGNVANKIRSIVFRRSGKTTQRMGAIGVTGGMTNSGRR